MNEGHLVTVTQGATAAQIATLVFLGILACVGIVWLVNWIISVKVGSLPSELVAIKTQLEKLTVKITEIEGKLWSTERVKNEIKIAIQDHELQYHTDK
ncbi:MAG: hypothetical protein MJ016_00915 [Victivallaceae bacterium]|nr:hypothetical protein [Victivallaceae bacterium]